MVPRSLIILAAAGAAVADLAPECEHVADVTALLQADDGKAYCSSILSVGTATETVIESTTTTETSTITTPSQIVLSFTSTETDTVTEGTVTETAATATSTSTVTESTTLYSCPSPLKRRDYGEAQSTSCTKKKTTSTPTPTSTSCTKGKTTPTPTPVKASTSCTKGQQHATPAAYGAGQPPAYSQGASSSAQEGHYAPDASKAAYPSQPAKDGHSVPAYPESTPKAAHPSQPAKGGHSVPAYSESTPKAYPSIPVGHYHNSSSAAYPASTPVGYDDSYPEQSSAAYDAYPDASSAAYDAYPVTSSVYKQISSLISSFSGYPTASSSAEYPEISSYYSSEIISSSDIYAPSPYSSEIVSSSEIYTPSPTPTPTPTPSCETAPSALQTGYACDTVNSACGCLGLTSATEHVTITTTITEAAYVTEAMLFTTTTQLTETTTTTVPVTETFTPSVTVTTTATATATVCPCSTGQSLCGSTPDTCKNLQNDANNCGTCGNVCSSGQCSAGKCLDCVPRKCGTFQLGACSNKGMCYCVTGSSGDAKCADFGNGLCSSYTRCNLDSECNPGSICTKDSCCPPTVSKQGVCLLANSCGNPQSVKRMFVPRGKALNEAIGMF